jgi:hypothetical protein
MAQGTLLQVDTVAYIIASCFREKLKSNTGTVILYVCIIILEVKDNKSSKGRTT